MQLKITFCFCFILPLSLHAGIQAFYCPQRHGYINIGMTADQVLSACGEPLSRQDSNNPVLVRVPVTQLIYNNQGAERPYNWYIHAWEFSSLKSGSGGVQMEMNIVDYKVRLIRINSSNSNVSSVCNGVDIKIGDSVAKVYTSCGRPSMVNHSFINQVTTPETKPQSWIYQATDYQPPFTLTIVDGKLQHIDPSS